jgi:hypothetical protein
MPTTYALTHAAIIARLTTLLSSHKRMANPYAPETNLPGVLRAGWGFAIAPGGENTQRFVCSTKSYRVNVTLVLTRESVALRADSAAQDDADIALMGDWETVLGDAHVNNLNAPGGALVRAQTFQGIQTVFLENALSPYRVLSANFDIEIFNA